MITFVPGIRNAVRALIVRDQAVLVQHKVYADGSVRYTLPGGAPDEGETLEEGLRRECLEEIGTDIEILNLAFVADFWKPRETDPVTHRQQVEFLFCCRLPAEYVPRNGLHPDKHQVDVLWLPFDDNRHKNFFPQGFSPVLDGSITDSPVYLGRVT